MQFGSAANDLGCAAVRKGLKCEMLAIPASGLHSYIGIPFWVEVSCVQWENECRQAFAGSYYVVNFKPTPAKRKSRCTSPLGSRAEGRTWPLQRSTVFAMQGD